MMISLKLKFQFRSTVVSPYMQNQTMINNIIVALSNLPIIYPMACSAYHGDRPTLYALYLMGFASFTSHLLMNDKHCLPGLPEHDRIPKILNSRSLSFYMNKLDVLACIILGSRFGYLFFDKFGWEGILILLKNKQRFVRLGFLVGLNAYSERDKYDPCSVRKYVIAHSLWHILVFLWIGNFAEDFIYN